MKSEGLSGNGSHTGSPRPSSILVVDDEVLIQTLLTEILTAEGYKTTTAGDGQEAVDLLERASFDLIITDLIMPRLDGVQVLRAAKRADPDYPVIMITGYPSADGVRKMIRLGAADYVVKPFNVDLVKVTVAKVLELRRQLDAAFGAGSAENIPAVDSVTGAYNLPAFVDLLETELARSDWREHACTLLVVKVERFHTLVAKHGHNLKQLVKRLHRSIRPGDIVGRTNQQEFAIIMPETHGDEAEPLRQKILGNGALWTMSTGVACFPEDGSNAQSLMKKARATMTT